MRFSSYGAFVAVMGYSSADSSVIDRGGNSVWRASQNGNVCRFICDGSVGVTVCQSKYGSIGYVWNSGGAHGWNGPFGSANEAMGHADKFVFGD